MQLQVTAESKLVLRLFSDVMPCSVVGIIKNHYGDNLKTFTSLRVFIEHFNWNKIHKHINPLNPELNHICYLLALLGVHHFLHVSRIRVKLLTFRPLMSYIHIYIYVCIYIYIYIYMEHLFLMFLDYTQRRSTVDRTPLDV